MPLNIKGIIAGIVLITVLYIIIKYWIITPSVLTHLTPAINEQRIMASTLSTSNHAENASNFTYSVWVYIEDWNYRYGDEKIVLARMTADTSSNSFNTNFPGKDPCPAITLSKYENNLNIYQSVFSSTSENSVHTCTVQNVPIQKWVNILVSVYGRTMDVYMDGKLTKTCMMGGTANISTKEDLYITPLGGFAGWTSYCQYFANATDPTSAWNIYKKGFGSSYLGNIINYQLKIDIEKNGITQKSFTV